MTRIDNFGMFSWKTFRISINNRDTRYNGAASGRGERYKSGMRSFRSFYFLESCNQFRSIAVKDGRMELPVMGKTEKLKQVWLCERLVRLAITPEREVRYDYVS